MTIARATHINQTWVDTERSNRVTALGDPRDFEGRNTVAWYQDENDVWQKSALKRDDDVLVAGNLIGRVVGPGSGREFVLVATSEEWGDSVGTFSMDQIFDRAPVDPNEDPGEPPFPIPEPE